MKKVKKIIYRPMILSLVMILSLIVVLNVSYGYFDALSATKTSTINIGDWLNNVPTNDNIRDYVEGEYPTGSDAENILNTLGTYNSSTSSFTADPTFQNYTMGELIETVGLINEFNNTYLNQTLSFPTNAADKPPLQVINNINSFNPGDVQFIRKTFMLANYESEINKGGTPVTFQVAIELPGTDLSDFFVEVLLDNTPLSVTTPFAYESSVVDGSTTYAGIKRNKTTNLVNITNPVTYNTLNQYLNVNFAHSYTVPTTITGNWTRFVDGATLSIAANNNYSTTYAAPTTGMKFIGKPNGSRVIMEFAITQRNPANASSLPIIPVLLVISRGKINASDARAAISPTVSMRVVDGDLKTN